MFQSPTTPILAAPSLWHSDMAVVCCAPFQGQLYPWQLLCGRVWICARNSMDNIGMFSSLLASAYTVKSLSAALSVRTPGGDDQKLGGDTARTADPRWPKGHSIWCHAQHIKLNKHEGKKEEPEKLWCLSSQAGITHSRGWLNTCLPMGSGEII